MAMASLVAGRLPLLVATFIVLSAVTDVCGASVRSITPTQGSLRGATRITIHGDGFSEDPFSYGEGNEDKGNKVYLKNDTATVECDVLPYWSNTEKVVCDTRAAAEGYYKLIIFVDGTEITTSNGESSCWNDWRCTFWYRAGRTPLVRSTTPMVGTPETKLTVYGKIITDQYASSQNTDEESDYETDDDDVLEIQRIFWGNYVCDALDEDTGLPYGIALDTDSNWGSMTFIPQGTFIDSAKISFLISQKYGRSKSEARSLRMSGQNRLYNYQTYAVVTGVEPSIGSIEGGLLVTISGNYFDAYGDMEVLIGGVVCDIQNISNTAIQCITNQAMLHDGTYPGSRGILWERWDNNDEGLDGADWDITEDSYVEYEVLETAESPRTPASNFVGRLRGYFVPPRDGDYRFYVRSDDDSKLFMSLDGDESNLTMICKSKSYSGYSWTRHVKQKSVKIPLEGNRRYYIEGRYNDAGDGNFIDLGFEMYDVPVSEGVLDGAYNEKQRISVTSDLRQEIQTITAVDTYEVQEVQILHATCENVTMECTENTTIETVCETVCDDDSNMTSCDETCWNETTTLSSNCVELESMGSHGCDGTGSFRLSFDGYTTGNLTIDSTAEEVAEELRSLTSLPCDISVSAESDDNSYTYTVVFEAQDDQPSLTVETNDDYIVSAQVTEVAKGKTAASVRFKFEYGGVQSSTRLSASSSEEDVQNALTEMFSVGCDRTSSANPTFIRDFEEELSGTETGDRVTDNEPYCGRTSLKDPEWIYQEGSTKNDDGSNVASFRVNFVNQLCFAFKGKIQSSLQLTLRYVSTEFEQVTSDDWYTSSELDVYDGYTDTWEHTCIDLDNMVSNQGWIKDDVYQGQGLYVKKIAFPDADVNQPLYIDNVFIGSATDQYTRTKAPASPNGIYVSAFTVTKNTTASSFDIGMTPASCGYEFPLLTFRDSAPISGSAEFGSDEALYSNGVQVDRMQSASVPLSGYMTLQLDGREVLVSVQSTARQIKSAVETHLDTGNVIVERDGDCYGYDWEIEWVSKGGSQGLIEVDESDVVGTGVSASVEQLSEGRLFMAPIPGEFLRTPHDLPQVEVMVNHIPSICVNSSCSFNYSVDATPQIDSITPASGSGEAGTTITISGSGFSDDPAENNVTIGGVSCSPTDSSDTMIACDVGPGPVGNYSVVINVETTGFAAGEATFEYEAGITNVDPKNGSLAGGTQITISGYGFPEGVDAIDIVTVAVGSKSCRILTVSYDEITCIVTLDSTSSRRRRRETDTVDVVVTFANSVVSESDGFTFDSSLTAVVSSISTNTSGVLGGGDLTISGSGFDSSGAMVTINDVECEITEQSNTEIVCAIPANSPGTYDLEVSVGNKGFADVSAITQFEYNLIVNGLSTDVGSLVGGSTVNITGSGFGDNETEVAIEFGDNMMCDILSIADDRIECEIQFTPTVVYVDNQGKHEEYGIGYKWSPQLAEVNVGDLVHFQWLQPTFVNGITYTVLQTDSPESDTYDGSGFYAGTATRTGTYAFRFNSPGTYYYSSGPVNSDGTISMSGTIKVSQRDSGAKKLSLVVGGYEASYDTSGGNAASSSDGSCEPVAADPSCSTSLPTGSDASSFYYSFWDCATPFIYDIFPNSGDSSVVIGITGSGFGNDSCQNDVRINGYACVAVNTTDTFIECMIETEDTFPIGNYDQVEVFVRGKGQAVSEIMSPVGRTFRMLPSIIDLSQGSGSTEGGNTLIVYGDGFSTDDTSDVSVTIFGTECVVVDVQYTMVTCVTGNPSGPWSGNVELSINGVDAECVGDCSYSYSAAHTPVVTNVTQTWVTGASSTVNIEGTGFVDNITVTVGGVNCNVTSEAEDAIECAVGYVPSGAAQVVVHIAGYGNSQFSNSDDATLWSALDIDSISPNEGSIEGGQEVTVTGNGFHVDDTAVTVDGSECVIQTISISEIVCVTPSGSSATVDLVVSSGGNDYEAEDYTFSDSETPTVTGVTPDSGVSGDAITISGSGFSSTEGENTVTIDGEDCSLTSAGTSSLECDISTHSAGNYTVMVHVQGKGYATSTTIFEYRITIDSATPSQGSFGGGPSLFISGEGFGDESSTTVTVCDSECTILSINATDIECDVPSYYGGDTEDCDIVVSLDSSAIAVESDGWQYREDLTPDIDTIDPPRGGTGGGTTLTITGTGFADSGNEVYIAGTECTVKNESSTEITCRTGAHSPSELGTVRVNVPDKGAARADNNSTYFYVDVWSSIYTWGGLDPPIAGDFVVVPAGQTLLLDVTTPILKMLYIQGGSVIFDEADITLNSEYILVMDDGLLQIGTHEEPFQHKATIMMHGHVRSKELPIYGAKTLAVRHGTLDLHGIPIPVTWTHLAVSVDAGDTEMTLMLAVTWNVGDEFVIASTGHRHSQRENEYLTITAISDDGTTLTFEPALEYDHISIEQTIDGVYLETRAEVGVLTRNVVVRGSVHAEWTETIEACDAEFDTNQFATQTCFRGKFGEETASDQFGSAIMLFAKEPDKHLSTGRIEYVEVTHAGQAFRLGRYAIHYHLNGNVTGNYVRGCGIHHTFNRAVTIHHVHHLLVEHNVVYNIMGHAFFTEDGIETKNIIQYNLAVFVRSSSSLLNVDVTPAAYWLTNADNYVRHNAAAGSSHFGFWYRAPVHPEGPSFTTSICPRNVPVLEFYNNTVHSHGWYGIWIFPVYYPREGGSCSSSAASAPAEFYNLTAWEVERGAEAVEVGNVRFINFLISDTVESGLEYQTSWDAWGGPMIKDSVIIGRSELSGYTGGGGRKKRALTDSDSRTIKCSNAGIVLPKSRHLIVDGVKFLNFDQDNCAAVRACGHCKPRQGGYESRLQNIEYFNTPNKARWKWQHETWLEDLDGSFSGAGAGYSVLPYNPNLSPDLCTFGDDEFGTDSLPGAICDDTVSYHRMAFNNPLPESLLYKETFFTNEHGTSHIPWKKKRLTHALGWMLTLIDGGNYNFIFEDRDHLTNISYNAQLDNFGVGDYVLFNHNFTQKPDAFSITGDIRNGSTTVPTYDGNDHGDWNFNNATKTFTYLVSGKGRSSPSNIDIDLDVYRCFHQDCIAPVPSPPPPPPNGRPSNISYWSESSSWSHHFNGSVPQDGDDVIILPGTYVVADTNLPAMKKLFIYGTLEFDDTRDYNMTATYILIQGGRLIIGQSEDEPFTHNVHIILEGNHFTPDIPLPNGPNLGSKALGSFGGLDLHGKNHSVYWTNLAANVDEGDDTLTVAEDTDWVAGDEIVVTTTDYEMWHTETFRIEEVTDARTFVLNDTFSYRHISGSNTITDGEETYSYGIKAKVGLLTRNIKIEGADYDDLIEESFGARVIVGTFFQDGELYQGYARISNVEFYHTGQEGWTDFYDPRYSLAFLDTGLASELSPSSVTGCSFHSGFSPAIGLFGAHGITVQDNVIHHVVGNGIIDGSDDNTFIHNLVSLVVFPGTYLDRFEPENLEWNGGFHITDATNPTLINNTVSGSERAGMVMRGEVCEGDTTWYGNEVHSTWICVFMLRTSLPGCSKVANLELYKCSNYGIYAQISSKLLITDVKMADNKVAILPLIYSPAGVSHQTSDKFVRVQNSLIVAMSPDFDCTADNIIPGCRSYSKSFPGKSGPSGGFVGFTMTAFLSNSNGAPFMSLSNSMSYPANSGISYLSNVMFGNFKNMCDREHKMIMSNPSVGDFLHPIHTESIRMVDVDLDNMLHTHRPALGLVNPSDCVDMDCDGMKKTLIRDLDGSLLGSIGTIIPDSAFEWDGDTRRGLGDYRIPPQMVTENDGSRIPYQDKMPDKGIYRGHNDECEWRSGWTAYECHGIDHMLMLVESLDPDTEVRRVSPVGLYSDSYIDLINGPQDHGWCHGYTCQERLSTFQTIVATGMEYEMVFSGTNPQNIRLHLLNAEDTQKVVVGIWYANPQRLDVYVSGLYITPNNAGYDADGNFEWRDDETPEEYRPVPSSNVYGENFFDRAAATLWINVRGADPITIRTTPVVMVTFGVPAITVGDFFEANLLQNLVDFLDVEPSQIRIVKIIAADSRRRKRAAEAQVILEIGDSPEATIDDSTEMTTGTPAPVTEAPPTTPGSSSSSSSLDYDGLVAIQSALANEMQTGDLGASLDITITSMAIIEPEAPAEDPTGGERATNGTGGPANGTTTFAEAQAEEEAESLSVGVVAIVYRIPTQLMLETEPADALEGDEFTVQPRIKVLDALGVLVDQLGTTANPWQLTATIQSGSHSNNNAEIMGNVTIPFVDGWANFTSLNINLAGSGVVLDFNVIYPNTSTLAVSSGTFDVTARPYYAVVVDSPSAAVEAGENFDVVVEVVDESTMLAVTDLADKMYTWKASVSFADPESYRGQLLGDLNATFDLATAQARFTNLSVNLAGYHHILEIRVTTEPSSEYAFSVSVDPFDVEDPDVVVYTGEATSMSITFDVDYDTVVNGVEYLFTYSFLNNIASLYPNATFSNVVLSEGSVIVTFDVQGDTVTVQQQLTEDLAAGDVITFTFNGENLVAQNSLVVDGEQSIAQPTTMPPVSADVNVDSGDEIAVFIIPVVVVVVIIIIIIVVLLVCKKMNNSKDKVRSAETVPLQTPRGKMIVESMASFNQAYEAPAVFINGGSSTSSSEPELHNLTDTDNATTTGLSIDGLNSPASKPPSSPRLNSPRRTPEISIKALPPGFSEGDEERVLEDRQRMYLMAKNTDGTFLKLGLLNVNLVGSVYDLRQDILGVLSTDFKDKKFVMMKETLKDIDGSLEKKLSVSQVYCSDCVLVRFVQDSDVSKMCICGLVGQFECSLCHHQAYCSPQCQSKDWPRHTMECSKGWTDKKL